MTQAQATDQSRPCSECGEVAEKVWRIEKDAIYCGRCYSRVFTKKVCLACGGSARVHRNDPAPLCRKCRNAKRQCVRCAKPVPKAGLIVAGQAVCPACVRHFKVAEPCPACGRLSKELSPAPAKGFSQPVCERCRGVYRKATCSRCRKHRRVAGRDNSGHPLCPSCAKPSPESHLCPDCHEVLPGGGVSRCRRCANKVAVKLRGKLNAEALRQPWAKSLFLSLCQWPGLQFQSPLIVRRIDRYADFFVTIDQKISNSSEVTTEKLLEIFGKEGLRINQVPVSFFAEVFQLDPSEKVLEDGKERQRIFLIKVHARNEPWAKELDEFEAHLRRTDRPRALAVKTVRLYIMAAYRVLLNSGKESMREISDNDVHRVLRKSPGLAASLTPFVRYLREKYGSELGPFKIRKVSPAQRDRKLLGDVRNAMAVLQSTTNLREARAHLAVLLSRLMGLPLKEVLLLHKTGLELKADRLLVRARPDEEPTEICGEAFALVRPWVERMLGGDWKQTSRGASGNPYMFEGRAINRAMNVASVAYWEEK